MDGTDRSGGGGGGPAGVYFYASELRPVGRVINVEDLVHGRNEWLNTPVRACARLNFAERAIGRTYGG